MKIHVELGKYLIQNKHSKVFAVWLSARHLFPCGHFIPSKENIERIGSLMGRKERAVRRLIAFGYKECLFRNKDCSGRLYIRSYNSILRKLRIDSITCFELELKDLPNLQEKLFAVYLEHLIHWRRKHYGLGNHVPNFWRQSYKKGDYLSGILSHGFSSEMLSVSYLSNIFNLSRSAIFKLKERAKKLRYVKFLPRLVPIWSFKRSHLTGLRENCKFGHFIVFRNGRYCFNATDYIDFKKTTKFLSRKRTYIVTFH